MCEECGMASVASPDDDLVCRNAGEGDLPGQMGISRGRSDAPLAFQPEEREKLETRRHQVSNEDLEHAALGSVAGVEVSAPSPEEGGLAAWCYSADSRPARFVPGRIPVRVSRASVTSRIRSPHRRKA